MQEEECRKFTKVYINFGGVIAIGMLGRALVVVCPESLSAPREENERIKAREHSPLGPRFVWYYVQFRYAWASAVWATLSVRHDDLLLGLI